MIAGWAVMVRAMGGKHKGDWQLHGNRKIYLARSIAQSIATHAYQYVKSSGATVVRVHLSGPESPAMMPTQDTFEHAEAMSVAWMEHAEAIREALRPSGLVLR